MCIEKVMSYQWAGKLYATELEAVKAALSEIATRLVKDYSTKPLEGLLALGQDISPLRERYLALAPAPISTESASEKEPTTLLEASDGQP